MPQVAPASQSSPSCLPGQPRDWHTRHKGDEVMTTRKILRPSDPDDVTSVGSGPARIRLRLVLPAVLAAAAAAAASGTAVAAASPASTVSGVHTVAAVTT